MNSVEVERSLKEKRSVSIRADIANTQVAQGINTRESICSEPRAMNISDLSTHYFFNTPANFLKLDKQLTKMDATGQIL